MSLYKLFLIISAVCILTYCLPKPGIIRPRTNEGDVHLNIPRGGAIVQPLSPINNTDDVDMTFVIDGHVVGTPTT